MRFFAIAALFLAACPGPEAPIIPEQSVIGPPAPAGDHCPREAVTRFAQRWFRVADLDTGRECTGFIEQDECVVALFRDCTDPVSKPSRSWQGSIDKLKHITLARTTESANGIMARSPTECRGDLVLDLNEPINTWAKLVCKIPMGEHGGFYFERIEEDIEPFARVDANEQITVFPDPPSDEQLPDLEIIKSRNEIWALVSTGQAELSGLYTGSIDGPRLQKSDRVRFTRATHLVISEDETFALIADNDQLARLELAGTSSITVNLGQKIKDVALARVRIANGEETRVLVALSVGSPGNERTEVRALDPRTLAASAPAAKIFDGDVSQLVPFDEEGTNAVALLTFEEDIRVKLIDSQLGEVGSPETLPEIPGQAINLPTFKKVAFAGESSDGYFTINVTDGTVSPKIKLPGGKITALFFNPAFGPSGRLLIATQLRLMIPFDVEHGRPLIQQILETPIESDMIRADASGRMYSFSTEKGVIDPLLQ